MEFDNAFDVPLAPEQAWSLLLDVPAIAPCMPGAELTGVIDGQTYKGRIAVRLGPVALTFAGTVALAEIDDTNRTARVKAQGSDAKGRGSANAAATFRVVPAEAGARVLIHTDLTLAGAVAQYGRGVGMIQATAALLVKEFAANLDARLAAGPAAVASPDQAAAPPEGPPPAAKPVAGLSLVGRAAWSQLSERFKGRRE